MVAPATKLRTCSGLAVILGLAGLIYLYVNFQHWHQGAAAFLTVIVAFLLLVSVTILAGMTFILVSWRLASGVSCQEGRWVIRHGEKTHLADTIRLRKIIPLDFEASPIPAEFVFFVADGTPWVCEKHDFPEG